MFCPGGAHLLCRVPLGATHVRKSGQFLSHEVTTTKRSAWHFFISCRNSRMDFASLNSASLIAICFCIPDGGLGRERRSPPPNMMLMGTTIVEGKLPPNVLFGSLLCSQLFRSGTGRRHDTFRRLFHKYNSLAVG